MTEQSLTTRRELAFVFHGDGMEYFKIWIVNLLLTIITIGIYGPWAKVRNTKYFYNHLTLDDQNFDYHADPVRILIGRVIALVVFVGLLVIGQLYPLWGSILFFLVTFGLMPWIIVASLRFRNRNSSYMNIRFNFAGTWGGAFLAFVLVPLVGVLTAGLLMPLALYKIREYITLNSTYGRTHFDFDATIGDYYIVALKVIGFGLLGAILLGLAGGLLNFAPMISVLVFPVFIIALYLGIYSYSVALMQNLQWNNTGLRVNTFSASLRTAELAQLYFVNIILLLVTLGLAIPFVKVRVARYFASCIDFVAAENLDNFVADEQEKVSAVGQEMGEFFDFDIGL